MELYRQSKILANFHEWLTTVGLIFLQDWDIPVATAYRPHDPVERRDPPMTRDTKSSKLPDTGSNKAQSVKSVTPSLKKGEKMLLPSKASKTEQVANVSQPEEKSRMKAGKMPGKELQPKNLVRIKAANIEKGKRTFPIFLQDKKLEKILDWVSSQIVESWR